MTWWNSIDTVQFWNNVSNIVGGIAGLITAVAVITSIAFNSRVGALQGAIDAKKESERQAAIQQANLNADEARKHVIDNIPNISGLLTPGDGDISQYLTTDEAKGALKQVPESDAIVVLGNCLAWTSHFPYAIITQGDEKSSEDMINIGKEDNELWVSARFFSARGQIICEIVRNRFHLNTGEYFRMEQTGNKLTVFDKEARMALDVEFVSPRAIRVLGDFYLRRGTHIAITPQWLDINSNRISGYIIGGTQRGAVLTN